MNLQLILQAPHHHRMGSSSPRWNFRYGQVEQVEFVEDQITIKHMIPVSDVRLQPNQFVSNTRHSRHPHNSSKAPNELAKGMSYGLVRNRVN
jgi:hypothetical protein